MPELDEEPSRALLDYLDAIKPPQGHDCWRELVIRAADLALVATRPMGRPRKERT